MNKQGIEEILTLHEKWLRDEAGGIRANLSGANGIISIESQYPYQSYGYVYEGEKRVRLGCFDRTIEEWDKDFWNNDKEFPEGSPQGKNRLFIYNCIRQWLVNNYSEEKI